VLIQPACRRAGVPLVVHFHGYDASRHEILERFAAGYQRMFRRCAAVVVVSRLMQEQLVRLGAPPQNVRLNPYGVDLERFTPTDAAANPPLFVAVGRFVEKKAPQLTLLAFRRVLEACPDARLAMLGDGVLLDACRDIVRALGLSDAVDLAGRQPHERVAECLAGARAFVQHSVTPDSGDCEGMPNAVLEAGACALPVVSTRHAGIPDAVVEGETGFLVEERDVEGMAQHMTTLALDPALAGRMGAAARERMVAEFSMEQRIAALHDILKEAAGGR
jgi:glycosyltransferase involved in cell wall biosynthesis